MQLVKSAINQSTKKDSESVSGYWSQETPPRGSTPSPVSPPSLPPALGSIYWHGINYSESVITASNVSRYLELHGLNTVGIFRVGTSQKRVRQVLHLSPPDTGHWLYTHPCLHFSCARISTAVRTWSWRRRSACTTWPPSSRSSSGTCRSPSCRGRCTSPCSPSRVSRMGDCDLELWP